MSKVIYLLLLASIAFSAHVSACSNVSNNVVCNECISLVKEYKDIDKAGPTSLFLKLCSAQHPKSVCEIALKYSNDNGSVEKYCSNHGLCECQDEVVEAPNTQNSNIIIDPIYIDDVDDFDVEPEIIGDVDDNDVSKDDFFGELPFDYHPAFPVPDFVSIFKMRGDNANFIRGNDVEIITTPDELDNTFLKIHEFVKNFFDTILPFPDFNTFNNVNDEPLFNNIQNSVENDLFTPDHFSPKFKRIIINRIHLPYQMNQDDFVLPPPSFPFQFNSELDQDSLDDHVYPFYKPDITFTPIISTPQLYDSVTNDFNEDNHLIIKDYARPKDSLDGQVVEVDAIGNNQQQESSSMIDKLPEAIHSIGSSILSYFGVINQ